MSCSFYAIGDLIESAIGGGWGKECLQDGYTNQVAVIRGVDFPNIENGNYDNLPIRWEKDSKAAKATLRAGDIVLEISGGTNDRPTGRTIFITPDLLAKYPCPIIPASFCRLIRPVDSINGRFLYYWLQDMYAKGRTWGYQNRSTGLSNFQFKTFAESEIVRVPDTETQTRIANCLEVLDQKRILNNRLNDYLANLCETIASRYCNDRNSRLRDICYQVADHVDYDNANQETYVSTESLMQNKGGRQLASSLPTTGKITRYKAGDTLISNIRPYFKKIWYAPFEGTCSGDVIVFRANDPSNAPYLHACLRQDSFFDYVMQGAKGTKMPRGDKKQMMEFKVASSCSAEDLILLDSVIKQRSDNDSEITKLQKLRDTLLPKLMSGEIDVSKIDLTQLTNNHLVEKSL